MEAIYKKHVTRFVIAVIFTLLAIFGLWRFGASMRAKELRAQEIKEHLASYEQNKKVYAQESVELKNISDRISKLERHRITVDTVPQLLSSLEAMAKGKNIVFDITSVKVPKKPEDAQTLVIEFSASGSYTNIHAYLQELLSQPFEVKFTRFSLFRSNRIETAALLDAQWELLGSIEVVSF
jgi:Tfp pilus assembly protein PilO